MTAAATDTPSSTIFVLTQKVETLTRPVNRKEMQAKMPVCKNATRSMIALQLSGSTVESMAHAFSLLPAGVIEKSTEAPLVADITMLNVSVKTTTVITEILQKLW